MKVKFCGAASTVTGSCHYVDTGHVKILVDCGGFQGGHDLERMNYEKFPFDPAEIDYLFLTHAHFDHVGRIPKLVKEGFRGKIICTAPTRDLARIVLEDAAHIQEEDYKHYISKVKDKHIPRHVRERAPEEGMQYALHEPLYTADDVRLAMDLFETYEYASSVELSEYIEFRMRDAGHILGSAIFELWVHNKVGRLRKLVFSGDLGQPGQRIVRDPDLIREADYVWVESTYGDRLHPTKDETVLEFLSILKKAQEKNGKILIPSFAIERTQEILYELNAFYEGGLLDDLEIYLDSPMARAATEVFVRYPRFYDEDAQRLLAKGDDPFVFPTLHFTHDVDESKRLVNRKGIAIIAGSGMATGGRIVDHLRNHLEQKETTVVFVGYQVRGTLGRRLLDGAKQVKIRGRELQVNADIKSISGFSAHGDQKDLRYWLRAFGNSPRKVFVVHGEKDIAHGFAENIRKELRLDAVVPEMFDEVEIE